MGIVNEEKKRAWRPQLTRQERRVGLVFFALYLMVFPILRGGVERLLDERRGFIAVPARANAVYYTLILLVLVAVFWDFLRHAVTILRDNLRPSLFAFGAGFFVGLGVTCLLGAIPLPAPNPEIVNYKAQFAMAPKATWLVAALLRPAVEEILYRGLLFGTVRRENRTLAYALSAGLFALAAVWQHTLFSGNLSYLLLLLQYLPLGLILSWSYDISGSVYTPMVLRMVLQSMFLILAVMSPGAVPPMGI